MKIIKQETIAVIMDLLKDGFTRIEIHKRTGISLTTIQKISNGTYEPRERKAPDGFPKELLDEWDKTVGIFKKLREVQQ